MLNGSECYDDGLLLIAAQGRVADALGPAAEASVDPIEASFFALRSVAGAARWPLT